MTEVLSEKKASSRIIDALGIAGVTIGSSFIMNPIVGSNNYLSAGAKLGVGLLSSGLGKGKATEIIGAGFLIDGSTDLINALFGGMNLKGALSPSASSQSSGSVFI